MPALKQITPGCQSCQTQPVYLICVARFNNAPLGDYKSINIYIYISVGCFSALPTDQFEASNNTINCERGNINNEQHSIHFVFFFFDILYTYVYVSVFA